RGGYGNNSGKRNYEKGEWRKHEHCTSACKHPTSTTKTNEYWEAMAQKCCNRCHRRPPAPRIEERNKHCDESWAYTFRNIDYSNNYGGTFTKGAQDIRHASF